MRHLSIDILKVTAAFFVVFIHLDILRELNTTVSHLLVNGIFRLSVPLFLIITGYFFTRIETGKDFIKWISRMLILYVVWSIIYLPFWLGKAGVVTTLINIFNGYYALWYITGVILAGCLLYLLMGKPASTLIILSMILYISGTLLQYAANLNVFSGIISKVLAFTPSHRNFLFDCLPFMIIGLLIRRAGISNVKNYGLPIVASAFALLIAESYLNLKLFGADKQLDMMFSLLLISPLLFTYIMKIDILGKYKHLSSFATAVYLVHPAIIFIGQDYVYDDKFSAIRYIFVIGVLVPVSYVLVKLNSKVKYLL